jgi:hypothetical protein
MFRCNCILAGVSTYLFPSQEDKEIYASVWVIPRQELSYHWNVVPLHQTSLMYLITCLFYNDWDM